MSAGTEPVATGVPELPLRDDLRGLTAYGAPQLDVPVRLNTNENPYPPPAELVADLEVSVAAAAATLNRYPDRNALELRRDLANYIGQGLGADQMWAANGSNEVIQQLLQAFGGAGRAALGFEPSYSMHRLIARTTGTRWIAVDRPADLTLPPELALAAVRQHRPAVTFVCTPNNPTGGTVAADLVLELLGETPGIVVVDEAYAEFSTVPSMAWMVHEQPRLVVTRTMSKAFGFAGARLGYLVAAPALVEALQLVRLPYHLSELTQAAARAALRHAPATLAQVAQICRDRERVAEQLRKWGLQVAESQANFLLFGDFDDAPAVWQALLDRGVLVRDVGLPGRLRVTIGTTAECDAFLTAVHEVLPDSPALP